MTLNNCNFLIIHYSEFDFLLNRNQITGSVSNIESSSLDSDNPYINEIINYGDKKLISIDLDLFLRNIFPVKDGSAAKLSVIADISVFSGKNREIITEIIKVTSESCDRKYISFSLSSQSEIKKIDIFSLKLFPLIFRKFYHQYGLLGCRFSEEGKIQYYTDIENLFFNALLKKERIM
ncbi:MAG: hypothetical protein JW982_01050 [Spirochaetes bacterium]|nr:hypothetical protein [Spirochaetota bacterium]